MVAERSEEHLMSAASPEKLELQALQQRDRLHRTALELIHKVDEAKEQLSLSHNVRKHFGAAAVIASAAAFLAGYAIGKMFSNT
jgi:hypothetical protein